MVNVIRYLRRIQDAEGLRLFPYLDHKKVPTIGYGTTHWEGRKVTLDWPNITKQRAQFMMYAEAMQTVVEAHNSVDNYNGLCDVRQECLAEMAYQLGGHGLRKFKNMIAAINRHDWYGAHDEALDSQMGRDPQLRSRTSRYANMLLMGASFETFTGR